MIFGNAVKTVDVAKPRCIYGYFAEKGMESFLLNYVSLDRW